MSIQNEEIRLEKYHTERGDGKIVWDIDSIREDFDFEIGELEKQNRAVLDNEEEEENECGNCGRIIKEGETRCARCKTL